MATARISGMIEEFKKMIFEDKVNIYGNNGRYVGTKDRNGVLKMLGLAQRENNQERVNYYQTMLDVLDGKRD
jgi:hypothetical protein